MKLEAVNVASLERGGWQTLAPGRICDCQKYNGTEQRLQQRVDELVCPLKHKATRGLGLKACATTAQDQISVSRT